MGYQPIRPYQPKGFYTKIEGGMAAAGLTALAWLDGALLKVVTGLLVEVVPAVGADAANLGWGIAAGPYTQPLATSSGGQIGLESQQPVGAGVAITGVRRLYYPLDSRTLWMGTLDDSTTGGGSNSHPLAVADIGTAFALAPIVTTTGVFTDHGQWIVDVSADGNYAACAVVTRLIDPPGALPNQATDPRTNNSGNALVEFFIKPSIASFWVS